MIFSEVRAYLKIHRRASLTDMCHRFDIEADALRGMLDKLIAKQKVEKVAQSEPACGGCSKCDSGNVEIYRWLQ